MNEQISQRVLKNLTILLIEPNDLFRDKITELVNLTVNRVVTAKSLDEAIVKYNTIKIDMIVMELNFTDENSFIFIKSLKKINQVIPIIIISTMQDNKTFLELIRIGVDDYLLKPLQIMFLKSALLKAAWKIYANGIYEITFKNNTLYNVRQKRLYEVIDNNINEIVITANESKLLDILLYNRKILLTQASISESIWENSFEISNEAFKSLLNRLRKKIGKESIKNISGRGYMLNI